MSEETKKAPAIRFQGFTDDWEQRKLGEVIDNQYNGQTPSRTNASFWNGEINWLSSGELNRGVVSETIEKITEDGRKNANLKIVPKGTFVMAITGLEAAGTRGNCAKLGIDTTMNQSCMALFPKKKLLDSSFLFQWYRKVGEEYGLQYTQGTKQQSYNAELLKILPIVLPSVSEQVLIADFFDKIDDTIDLHQRKLTLLEQLKQTYLQVMFPQGKESIPKLRFTDHSEPWEQRKLGEVGSVVMCKRIFKDQTTAFGDIPFYKIGTFGSSPDSFIPNELFEEYKKNYPYPEIGDILMSASGTIGRTVVYEGEKAYYQDSNIVWLKTDKSLIDNSFLKQFYQVVKWSGLEGSTIKRLYNSNILSTGINLPSLREQTKLGTFFNQIDNTIALHQEKIAHLKALKSTLLNKMFI